MKKKIWMMLLCGALVCFPLGGCGINRADADTGSVQSEAASDHKTTKNSNAEYRVKFQKMPESRTAQTAVRNTPAMCLPWILI